LELLEAVQNVARGRGGDVPFGELVRELPAALGRSGELAQDDRPGRGLRIRVLPAGHPSAGGGLPRGGGVPDAVRIGRPATPGPTTGARRLPGGSARGGVGEQRTHGSV